MEATNFTSKFVCILTATILFGMSNTLYAGQQRPTPQYKELKPFLACDFGENLSIVEINERNCTEPFRTVTVDNVKHKVSVIEGYRIILRHKVIDNVLINFKIEKSNSSKYLDDKSILLKSIKYLSNNFKNYATGNFDIYNTDFNAVRTGVVNVDTMFMDYENLVITSYLINNEEDKRKFRPIEEYKAIVDTFFKALIKCNAE